MPRYLITNQQPAPADATGIDWNRDGVITLSERIASAAVGAAATWGCLQVLWWVICILFAIENITRPWVRWWMPATTLLVALASTALLVWRMIHIERAERELEVETSRRRRFEDEQRQWTQERAAPPSTVKLTQARIDRAAWVMLQAYYETGSMTRGTVAGVSDPEWNEANALLKAAAIRRGRGQALQPATLAEAWAQYIAWKAKRRAWDVDADGDLKVKP